MIHDFHIVIPARYQSSRLPGKLLIDLKGQTTLERTYRQAQRAQAKSIVIATDHEMIAQVVREWGAEVMMTDLAHQSGTDRLAEVIARGDYHPDDIIVNVQGDEPFIPPELIVQVANSLLHSEVPVATLCWPLSSEEEFHNPNVVKVVRNQQNHALYFSRSPIPMHRDAPSSLQLTFRHIGLYAYRAAFLKKYVTWPVSPLESLEALEQLRVLWSGYQIKVDEACVAPQQEVNTAEDLARALEMLG